MLHIPGVLDDVAVDGVVLVNSSRSPSELALDGLSAARGDRARHRTSLARRLGRPLPNTCLLGALAGLTGAVDLTSLQRGDAPAVRAARPAT